MNRIDVYSKADCKLCEEAKELFHRLNGEFGFEVKEIPLSPSDPEFKRYQNSFPVAVASNGKTVSGKITEEQARDLFISLTPPPPVFYVAKFLEALALVGVLFGLIYGLLGDMWLDLYFFLGGIVVFAAGRMIEKWEVRRRRALSQQRTDPSKVSR